MIQAGQNGSARRELAEARVLMVMPSIPVRGMERANLQILRMLQDRGAEVLVLTMWKHGEPLQRQVELAGGRWRAARILYRYDERLHLSRNPYEMAGVLWATARGANEVYGIGRKFRPTHIHITNFAHCIYALPAILCLRCPVVFRIPNPPDSHWTGSKRHVYEWLWKSCINSLCNVFVCNSEYTRRQLVGWGIPHEKAVVIRNCLPERAGAVHRDAPTVRPGKVNVVFLGHLIPQKGASELYEVALRLVQERDDVDFYFAGEHNWMNPFADGLITETQARGLESRIYFTGEIEDVYGLLSQCHIHVCPSVSAGESFPNVLLEAKFHRLPTVAFPTAGIPEAITHLVDGYLCRDRSPPALCDGIRHFLDDPTARKHAGDAAYESLRKFDPTRIGDEWASLFKNLSRTRR